MEDITQILTATEAAERLLQMGGDPGTGSEALESVGKNIPNSSIYGVNKKVDPTLKSAEKSRLKNKMDVIVESWFKLKKKYVKDEKGKTVVGKVAKDAEDMSKQLSEDGKKQGKGLLAWLAGLLGMLGLGKTSLGKSLLKVIGGWLWKSIKWIGGKVWGFIKWGIKKGWGLLKGIFAGVWKSIRWLGRSAWNLLKGAIAGIGKFFGKLWTGFKNLPVWKAFNSAISSGVNFAKGIFTSAKNTIVNALTSVGNFFKGALQKIPGIGKIFPALAKTAATGATGTVTQTVAQSAGKGNWFTRGAKWLGGKAVQSVKAVGTGAKWVGGKAMQGVKFVGEKAVAPAMELVKRGFAKVVGKGGANVVKFLGGAARRIPILGPAIEALFTGADIIKMKKRHAEDPVGFTAKQLNDAAGTRAIKGITAAIGAGAGAFLGGIAGAVSGPLAFLGVPIASILGALTGDILGRFAGGLISKYVMPESAKQSIGKMFTGVGKAKTMQDFIMQRGTVMPFSSKDDLLGMKAGGAISQLLNDPFLTETETFSSRLAALQISAIELSNQYLHRLVQLTEIIVKKPSGGGPTPVVPNVPLPQNNDLQGNLAGPSYPSNTSNYYNSPYSMHTPGMAT